VPQEKAAAIRESLAANAESARPNTGLVRYPGRIPVILPATQEESCADGELRRHRRVSFKKGCYPGQEIVARMHYLGRLKQRMVLATSEAFPRHRPATASTAPISAIRQAALSSCRGGARRRLRCARRSAVEQPRAGAVHWKSQQARARIDAAALPGIDSPTHGLFILHLLSRRA